MLKLNFDNTYARLGETFSTKLLPEKFESPKLIAFNRDLFHQLGGSGDEKLNSDELAQIFSGQKLLDGSEPLAQVYAAHQFGHFNPRLGDGRAHLLGEIISPEGHRFDIQLKGSGQTPYSRRGDGRSAIGPVLREYIVSEAMHFLGVKTTRALAAVWSGEEVYRQDVEPGGIFTRIASSHLRIGTLQYFLGQQDYQSLSTLIDYTIERHYPEAQTSEQPVLTFFSKVCERLNDLVSDWMSLGFIHGVMNTDNTTFSGETIDFGPCAFMDDFKSDKFYSFVDREGRYRYENQASIIQWNLARLAECLIHKIDSDEKKAIELLTKELEKSKQHIAKLWHEKAARKLGLIDPQVDDASIVRQWFQFLEKNQLDFTLSFRHLQKVLNNEEVDFFPQRDQHWEQLQSQLQKRWNSFDLEEINQQMNRLNPWFIPRNHLVEKAIQEALRGEELLTFKRLNQALQNPYEYQKEFTEFYRPPKKEEEVKVTFCGT